MLPGSLANARDGDRLQSGASLTQPYTISTHRTSPWLSTISNLCTLVSQQARRLFRASSTRAMAAQHAEAFKTMTESFAASITGSTSLHWIPFQNGAFSDQCCFKTIAQAEQSVTGSANKMLLSLRQKLAALRARRRSSDKLLFRLLALSVHHAEALCILLYTCGTLSLLVSPLLSVPARSMETALLAGQADSIIR